MNLFGFERHRPIYACGEDERVIAGISGGSTSATMAVLCDARTLLCFQNTGREARRTYEFLEGSLALAHMDPDEEDEFVLSLPSEEEVA